MFVFSNGSGEELLTETQCRRRTKSPRGHYTRQCRYRSINFEEHTSWKVLARADSFAGKLLSRKQQVVTYSRNVLADSARVCARTVCAHIHTERTRCPRKLELVNHWRYRSREFKTRGGAMVGIRTNFERIWRAVHRQCLITSYFPLNVKIKRFEWKLKQKQSKRLSIKRQLFLSTIRKTELFRQNIASNRWDIRYERSNRHNSFSIRLRCHGASVAFSWSKYV